MSREKEGKTRSDVPREDGSVMGICFNGNDRTQLGGKSSALAAGLIENFHFFSNPRLEIMFGYLHFLLLVRKMTRKGPLMGNGKDKMPIIVREL